MNKKNYNNPNITINKVYTKKGDLGETSIIGGQKLTKCDLRICAYGEIDELNSYIGGCKQKLTDLDLSNKDVANLINILKRIQNELFNIGNMLATPPDYQSEKMPKIEQSHITSLENDIDYYNQNLPILNSFVLPGGSELNIWFHIARTLCRKCERIVVQLFNDQNIDVLIIAYLNRLSDALFVFSRWSNEMQSIKESLWDPNKR